MAAWSRKWKLREAIERRGATLTGGDSYVQCDSLGDDDKNFLSDLLPPHGKRVRCGTSMLMARQREQRMLDVAEVQPKEPRMLERLILVFRRRWSNVWEQRFQRLYRGLRRRPIYLTIIVSDWRGGVVSKYQIKFALTVSWALLVVACAPITPSIEITQPVGEVLHAGIGDTVLTVNQRESMPNAFGRADIFGRTRPTGMVTVQFIGLEGTIAKFVRNGIAIDSGLTTMNSTPLILPNSSTSYTSGNVGGTPIYGTTTTYGTPTVIPADPPPQSIVPQDRLLLQVDTSKERTVLVAGKIIEIIDVSPTILTYRIQWFAFLDAAR
jgi:hypothetical protein